MFGPAEWLRKFEEVAALPEDKIDLARAALVIAGDEYSGLDVDRYLALLDEMAAELRPHFNGESDIEKITLLNDHVFGKLGFHGDRETYYDPRNSYLNDVLDRRTGIPITLSLVYMEIGWRLGCPLFGVAMPGHFVVKWRADETVIFVDPYNEGQVIGHFDVSPVTDNSEHAEIQQRLQWMESATRKQILMRMLGNLRQIFLKQKSYEQALPILEKMLILQPNAPDALREAGLLAYEVRAYRRAQTYLRRYVDNYPSWQSTDSLRVRLREVEELLLRLN